MLTVFPYGSGNDGWAEDGGTLKTFPLALLGSYMFGCGDWLLRFAFAEGRARLFAAAPFPARLALTWLLAARPLFWLWAGM